ncbi:MAG: tRNA lysidine(34) synthetase TilS [Clostridia bacterium]|nr:tRNA lysidine(34) synthetase TilS [Clostridia bacterium]
MISEIKRADREYGLISGVGGILVALSGGADSMALLYSLRMMKPEYGYSLFALHINHGIRGDEAKRDEMLCRKICKEWDIPLTVLFLDIPKMAKERGKGIEETGRDARYEALEKERIARNCDVIATAHHASDNLETMLFNLQRGTSITGLCGIPPKRGCIVRPLILIPKKEILNYCRENNIEFATDSTNSDDAYTRNFIRLNIVPQFEKLNPEIAKTAGETAVLLRRDKALLDGIVPCEITRRSVVAKFPDALLSRYIIGILPSDCPAERIHINSAMNAIRQSGDKVLDFPNDYRLVCENDIVKIVKKSEITEISPMIYDFTIEKGIIELPGKALAGVGLSVAELCKADDITRIYNLSIFQSINFGKIKGNIHVRSRREGDTYLLGGVHRTVKKLMQSLGKGKSERARLPFFCDDEGICWIPGFPPRDGLSGTDAGFSYFVRREVKNDIEQ